MATNPGPSSRSENLGAETSSEGGQGARSSFGKSVQAAAQGTDTFDDQVDQPIRRTLLNQFYATLRVTYLAARESTPESAHSERVIDELERLFADEKKTWQKAYNLVDRV